eukprot:CAMPEP_0116123546 /NCGR_PEP_ID=MMETSP0329-20121206/4806_1 /TAXON_ID=697910 /ORGANISM="Pseudo-nitzschia arenysensis, Strain B593" /LENGTH=185 /DNA_ID=CAMNT_0003617469 /DNA_START=136 /DNA_END=696 /DNA_ORIENTATION=+
MTTTTAFHIIQPARITIPQVDGRTQLNAFSFHTVGSLLISDDMIIVGDQSPPTEAAIAAASDTAEVFTDQIDYFGDPMVRTLFFVFGGVVVLLAGFSVLSQKVDDAIESVIVDFESVLRTDPEFRSKWQDIAPQLEQYEADGSEAFDGEKELKRKQKLFEIMEEMQEKEPELMQRINRKMEALKN